MQFYLSIHSSVRRALHAKVAPEEQSHCRTPDSNGESCDGDGGYLIVFNAWHGELQQLILQIERYALR